MNNLEAKLKCLELSVHICRARHEHDEMAVVNIAEVLYAFANPDDIDQETDKPKRGRPRKSPNQQV